MTRRRADRTEVSQGDAGAGADAAGEVPVGDARVDGPGAAPVRDPAPEDEIGGAGNDRPGDGGEVGAVEGPVGVHEADDIGGGRLQAGEARGAEAAARLGNDDGAEFGGEITRAVSRAVVYDDGPEPVGQPAEYGREGGDLVEDREHDVDHRRVLPALVGWTALVVAAAVVGEAVVGPEQGVEAAPFFGQWEWRVTPAIGPAIAIAIVVLAVGDRVTRRVSWRPLLAVAGAVAVAWTFALAASDGLSHVAAPLESRYDYLAVVPSIDHVGEFVRTFTERIGDYPIHVRGHPPGMPLLLWLMDTAGLGGPGPAAALILVSTCLLVVAVLVTCRAVAGEAVARRAAPFVALMPAALWLGTSADAVFASVIATGIALAVATRLAWLGGAVLGLALLFTYGAVPLLAVPAAVLVHRRAWLAALATAAGIAAVLLAAAVAGFRWPEGLAATRDAYADGIASDRSYAYFTLLGNPGAFAVAIGPGAVAGLGALRDRRLWLLCGAALAALLAADVSGLSKAEVERIWLPYVPWVVVAAAALRRWRPLLALSAASAIVMQLALRSAW